MEEIDKIQNYVARHIELTPEERDYFASVLRVAKVKKKQCIVQPGFVCRYRNYIYTGAMRSYLVGNDGQEHTELLSIDDWWITDYNSYIYQQPATLFVEAVEDSVLVQFDHQSEQLLLKAVPKFERFFRIITERSLAFFHRRMLSNLSMTAEERYEEFVTKYPLIPQKVPQYILASYLGMSTEYLSTLRNNRVINKS